MVEIRNCDEHRFFCRFENVDAVDLFRFHLPYRIREAMFLQFGSYLFAAVSRKLFRIVKAFRKRFCGIEDAGCGDNRACETAPTDLVDTGDGAVTGLSGLIFKIETDLVYIEIAKQRDAERRFVP